MMHFPTTTHTWQLQSSALTDRGQKRQVNEDSVFQFSDVTPDDETIGLYIVCDGMGGHEAGAVASHVAVQTIVSALSELLTFEDEEVVTVTRPLTPSLITKWLQTAIWQANKKIRDLITEGAAQKMGTTVNVVFIYNNQAYIANVGDSRTYLWQADELTLVTADHSITNEMVKTNTISAEEAYTHPMRNLLTQAVDGKNGLKTIDIFERPLQPGDRLLLCSDGLWQVYREQSELGKRMAEADSPGDLCWQLVGEANQRDGSDNISAVAVFMD